MGMNLKTYITTTGASLEDITAKLAGVLPKAPHISTVSRHANRNRDPDWNYMMAYRTITDGLVDFSDWAPVEHASDGAEKSTAHRD